MNKCEAINKVKVAIEEAGLTKEDILDCVKRKETYRISGPVFLSILLCFITLASYYICFTYKDVLNDYLIGSIFIIGCYFAPAYVSADLALRGKRGHSIFPDFTIESSLSFKGEFQNKLSLPLYRKITPFLNKEEIDDILSFNLTYEDLDIK